MAVTIQQLSKFQVCALKNLYDQDIWPEKIGIVHETGNLVFEYTESGIDKNGNVYTEMKTAEILHEPAKGA